MPGTPFADLPLTNEAWSAPNAPEVLGELSLDAAAGRARARRAHLYAGDEGARWGDYKLPIAKLRGGKLVAYERALAAAIAVINGGRGGVDISPADRRTAYNHAARYYRKMDRPPPRFRG